MSINTLIQKSIPINLLDDAAASVGNGDTFALPAVACLVSWQTIFGTDPSAISILLQGSLDGITWDTIDSSTEVTGELRSIETSSIFVRGRIASITDGDDVTLVLVAKPLYFLASSSPFDQFLNKTSDVQFNQLGLGNLFTDWTEDPIYLTAINSKFLQGYTVTKTDHNNFLDYLAASIEPEADNLIAAGRETLMYTPATNTHTTSSLYGDEVFYQGYSNVAAGVIYGRNTYLQQFGDGNVTSLLGNNFFGENDGAGTVTRIRGSQYGAGNFGAGLVTNIEYIKMTTPQGSGVTTVKGLLMQDLSLAGATGHAIDCNSNFKVGLDGKSVVMVPITSDPHIVGAVWNNAGTLTISAG